MRRNPRGLGGPSVFSYAPFTTPVSAYATGVVLRPYTSGNDYGLDRDGQRGGIFSGIRDFATRRSRRQAASRRIPLRWRSGPATPWRATAGGPRR